MKLLQTLILIAFTTSVFAQKPCLVILKQDDDNFQPSKFAWDITLASGSVNQGIKQLGGKMSFNGRFRNRFYTSADLMRAFEFKFSSKAGKAASLNHMAVVAGMHYSQEKYIGAVGIGYGYSSGYVARNYTDERRAFTAHGLEMKAQATIIMSKNVGFSATYNYNINKVKNISTLMLGVNIGLMQ